MLELPGVANTDVGAPGSVPTPTVKEVVAEVPSASVAVTVMVTEPSVALPGEDRTILAAVADEAVGGVETVTFEASLDTAERLH